MPPLKEKHIPVRRGREALKQAFKDDKNNLDFVFSTLNKIDDKISTSDDKGLILESRKGNQRLISFMEQMDFNRDDSSKPAIWDIAFKEVGAKKSLEFTGYGQSILSLNGNGYVRIGKPNPNVKDDHIPRYPLDVKGVLASEGRIGTYAHSEVPADGQWHDMKGYEKGAQAFEVVAHVRDPKQGRYALTYAIVLKTDRKGEKARVHTTSAGSNWLWGRWFNKIQIRWKRVTNKKADFEGVSDRGEYVLQIRSRRPLQIPGAAAPKISFRISKIWDEQYELSGTNYTSQNKEYKAEVPPTTTPSPIERPVTPPVKRKEGNITIKSKKKP